MLTAKNCQNNASRPKNMPKTTTRRKVTKKTASKPSALIKQINRNLVNTSNLTLTDNGAISNRSSKSAVLDFFGLGGAVRQRPEADLISMFSAAFNEDKLLASKCLFYFRDVRGGQGERRLFRVLLKWMAQNHPDVVRVNLANVSFFGRWDDLYTLFGTPLEDDVLSFLKNQLNADIKADQPTLAGKWISSINTSSAATRAEANKLAKYLGWTPKKYRKTLSKLRAKLKVIERVMCQGEWGAINYEHVPSRAAMIYRNAFKKHDEKRYADFLGKVEKGEAKINASTLYPYDLVGIAGRSEDRTVDAQWKALPDYCADNPQNTLVVCDVSGSMGGVGSAGPAPINIAISLALYFGERIKGKFENHFLTFSQAPTLQEIRGKTLHEKVQNLGRAHWDGNTNVQAAFELILREAKAGKVPQKEMPDRIMIVSDMQFDVAVADNSLTNFQAIEAKYKASGYKMPQLVFWNVNAFNQDVPVQRDQKGTILVSGASPAVFATFMSGKEVTPYDQMVEALGSERYSIVTI